ncbi:DUF3073 domain-containing protein [Kocuria palustris]|uniref:DUF3073 domain-containing protein n=1 Tax=Kocuria palustris TaxID=71999 RepID=UPI0011A5A6D5|nr:DUF3073 domain-containing protein [Kocuria palustris]
MGRGRQKAKATRQAREMKYFSPETDYSALQRELRQSGPTEHRPPAVREDQDDLLDPHADDQDSYEYDDRRR